MGFWETVGAFLAANGIIVLLGIVLTVLAIIVSGIASKNSERQQKNRDRRRLWSFIVPCPHCGGLPLPVIYFPPPDDGDTNRSIDWYRYKGVLEHHCEGVDFSKSTLCAFPWQLNTTKELWSEWASFVHGQGGTEYGAGNYLPPKKSKKLSSDLQGWADQGVDTKTKVIAWLEYCNALRGPDFFKVEDNLNIWDSVMGK